MSMTFAPTDDQAIHDAAPARRRYTEPIEIRTVEMRGTAASHCDAHPTWSDNCSRCGVISAARARAYARAEQRELNGTRNNRYGLGR